MSHALAETAEALQCDERTLRRYANQGLLRGERRGRRELRLPYGEERYLRQHWGLLSGLRRALRTEHGVRLAVLFGSTATGDDLPGSDVDLLIEHSTGDLEQVAELRRRLQKRVERPIHLVLLDDARESPALLADILREGRVIVDRDGAWRGLTRRQKETFREAAEDEGVIRTAARQAIADARVRLGAR
jgi:predicted nucleotidyltransferase